MVVQHNMQAMNTNRQLGITTGQQAKSTEKLSSGYKINRAGDDAAGLAISEKMRSQIRGLDKASSNAEDGISVVQTAEGALNEVHSILQRMNELATQAANDTNTSVDRSQLQLEINQLTAEIDRIASTTQFNTMNLLDGTFDGKHLQVGALANQSIDISIGAMNATALEIVGSAETEEAEKAEGADETEGTGEATEAKDATATGSTGITATVEDGSKVVDGTLTYGTYMIGATDPKDAEITSGSDTGATIAASSTLNGTYRYKTHDGDGVGGDSTADGWYDSSNTKVELSDVTFSDSYTAARGDTISITAHQDANAGTSATGWSLSNSPEGASDVLADSDAIKAKYGVSYTGTASAGATIAMTAKVEASGGDDKSADGTSSTKASSGNGLSVMSFDEAGEAMTAFQSAIDKVSTQRATLGAIQNRLEHTIANLDTTSENTSAAESRIRDTDMASEMVQYSKNNILAQAGQSMLAQANQSTQGVLSLLG